MSDIDSSINDALGGLLTRLFPDDPMRCESCGHRILRWQIGDCCKCTIPASREGPSEFVDVCAYCGAEDSFVEVHN